MFWRESPDFSGDANFSIHAVDDTQDVAALFQLYLRHRDLTEHDRPPWRLMLLRDRGNGSALMLITHHSVCDGYRLIHMLFGLADEKRKTAYPAVVADKPEAGVAWFKRLAAGTIGPLAFALSGADALVRSLRSGTDVSAANATVYRQRIDRSSLRRLAANWRCSSETVCYLLALKIERALAPRPRSKSRLIVPLVFRRTTSLHDFRNFLLPLELTAGAQPDIRLAGKLEAHRKRIARLLSPFVLKIAERYISAGVRLTGLMSPGLVRRMRCGWGSRFSASCTVFPVPPHRLKIGGATTTDILCFTPQLTKDSPAITFATYGRVVNMVVRYSAEIPHAANIIAVTLDRAFEPVSRE